MSTLLLALALLFSESAQATSYRPYYCLQKTRDVYETYPDRPVLMASFLSLDAAALIQVIELATTKRIAGTDKDLRTIAPMVSVVWAYLGSFASVHPPCEVKTREEIEKNPDFMHRYEPYEEPTADEHASKVRKTLIIAGVNLALQTVMLATTVELWSTIGIAATMLAAPITAVIVHDRFTFHPHKDDQVAFRLTPTLLARDSQTAGPGLLLSVQF